MPVIVAPAWTRRGEMAEVVVAQALPEPTTTIGG
jgi:hypothetical protein